MRARTIISVAAAVLLATACGPDKGTVTDKAYTAPYTSWNPGYWSSGMCYSYDSKTGACRSRGPRIWHPATPVFHPATWSMKIVDGEDSGWRYVNSGVWESCAVGQWFEADRCSGTPGEDHGGAW